MVLNSPHFAARNLVGVIRDLGTVHCIPHLSRLGTPARRCPEIRVGNKIWKCLQWKAGARGGWFGLWEGRVEGKEKDGAFYRFFFFGGGEGVKLSIMLLTLTKKSERKYQGKGTRQRNHTNGTILC